MLMATSPNQTIVTMSCNYLFAWCKLTVAHLGNQSPQPSKSAWLHSKVCSQTFQPCNRLGSLYHYLDPTCAKFSPASEERCKSFRPSSYMIVMMYMYGPITQSVYRSLFLQSANSIVILKVWKAILIPCRLRVIKDYTVRPRYEHKRKYMYKRYEKCFHWPISF